MALHTAGEAMAAVAHHGVLPARRAPSQRLPRFAARGVQSGSHRRTRLKDTPNGLRRSAPLSRHDDDDAQSETAIRPTIPLRLTGHWEASATGAWRKRRPDRDARRAQAPATWGAASGCSAAPSRRGAWSKTCLCGSPRMARMGLTQVERSLSSLIPRCTMEFANGAPHTSESLVCLSRHNVACMLRLACDPSRRPPRGRRAEGASDDVSP